jgi:NhaP-type Na+/H+ or K+/H+ antiporter
MANETISLAVSAVSFGIVVGFLAGYAVRSVISRRRRRNETPDKPETQQITNGNDATTPQ